MPNRETKDRLALWVLVTIFVCVAVGIVAAGYVYYRNYEKQYRSEVERQLSAIADLKAGELVQWRKERLGDGAVFFKNNSFSGLVRRFLERPEDAEARRAIQAWIEKFQTDSQYAEVRLLDAHGATRLSIPAGGPELSSTLAQRLPEVLRTDQVTFKDFYRNEHDQRVCLAILVPLLDEGDAGHPLGVLVLRIDPATYLYPFIKRWPTPSRTAETLLVRREGNEVVFLNELRFQPNAVLNLRIPLDRRGVPAVEAALGTEGVVKGIDYRGVPVMAALRAIPDSPWSLVARMDTAEVYAPLREQLTLVVALIGALLVGAGTSVALLWRQQSERFYRDRYEAAEALVASEVRYRRLFEAARDGILILDAETGMIVDVNPFLIEMLGFSQQEFLGKKVWELGAFKDIVANQDSFAELQRQKYIRYEDMALEGHDGKRHEVEFVSNVYLVNHQKVIQCNIRDISERRRAEEALRQQTEELRARNAELMRFNRAAVGRELQMVELKQQINELCRQLGQPPRHPLDFLGAKPQTTIAAEAVGPEGASRTDANSSEERFSNQNQINDPRGVPQRTAN